VLDWANMRYGDPLYDVAYLQLYLTGNEEIVDRSAYVDYDARLRCCLLFQALDGLRFYARTNQLDQYRYLQDRVTALGLDDPA
jgi:hypothetical protein